MHALLLIAHGSRRRSSNEEIAALARSLDMRAGGRFASVRHAFLELAEPGIEQAIDRLAADGATAITVLPYFLAAGNHVREDIPALLDRGRARHPGVAIEMRPYLGTHAGVVDLLLEIALGEPG
jgi:sirohydrochlorin ferrochelatase